MPVFLDTTGQATLGIGICDRCKRKFPLAELLPDGNSPGLRVCRDDRDVFDPWRLPPRQVERITLPFYRPDESLVSPGQSPPAAAFKLNDRWYWDIEAGPLPFPSPVPPPALPPTDIALLNSTVPEQAFGAVVGGVVVADPGLPATVETVTVTNDTRFIVPMFDNFEGTLELIPSAQLLFALEPTVSLMLRATNSGGKSFSKNFTISVTPLPAPPQAPSSLNLSNLTVLEHTPGATVGTLTATDPNLPPPGSSQTMTVTNDARFSVTPIDGFTGTLALLPGQQVDFAMEPAVTLTVRTTNAFGLFLEHVFVITVIPVGPPPVGRAHSSGFSDGFS